VLGFVTFTNTVKGSLAYTTPKSRELVNTQRLALPNRETLADHKTRSQSKDPFVLTERKSSHEYKWKVVSGRKPTSTQHYCAYCAVSNLSDNKIPSGNFPAEPWFIQAIHMSNCLTKRP
jgi:hypothetical protein